MSDHQDYYVYLLCRPCGAPFYVGKGRRYRIKDHEIMARVGSKRHVCNIIRKIWREGGEIVREKLATGLTNDEAIAMEIGLIALHGRKCNGGILCNQTDGGDGARGWKHDEKSLAKMRAWKRKPVSEKTRLRLSASLQGREVSAASREKISKSLSGDKHWNWGKKISREHAEKLHESRRGISIYVPGKRVKVDGAEYKSIAEASRVTGIKAGTIWYQTYKAKKPHKLHAIEAI